MSTIAPPNPSGPVESSNAPGAVVSFEGLTDSPSFTKSATVGVAALAFGHFAVDCCAGIWPVYKTVAHLDLVKAGLIATLAGLIANGLQIVFGIAADRGHARVLSVCGAVLAGAVTFVPYTSSYPLLFALVLATSVGSAAFHPSATGSAGALSYRHTGLFVALFLAGGYVGYALSQIAFTTFYSFAPKAPALLAILPLFAASILWRFTAVSPRQSSSLAQWVRSVRAVSRSFAVLFVIQLFAASVNIALVFLLPDLLVSRAAPIWLVEGGGHFALVLGGCLLLVPAGHASDRFGARKVLLIANLIAGSLFLIMIRSSQTPWSMLLLVALFGAFNGANNVVAVSEGNRLLRGQGSGASALLMGVPWCFASLSSVIAGTLADPARGGSPSSALTWIALCIPVTIGASALLRPKE